MSVGKNKNKHRETPAARKEIGFTKGDIIAAQKGSTNAWHRIRSYFMPRIRYLVYQHRPGHTARTIGMMQAVRNPPCWRR